MDFELVNGLLKVAVQVSSETLLDNFLKWVEGISKHRKWMNLRFIRGILINDCSQDIHVSKHFSTRSPLILFSVIVRRHQMQQSRPLWYAITYSSGAAKKMIKYTDNEMKRRGRDEEKDSANQGEEWDCCRTAILVVFQRRRIGSATLPRFIVLTNIFKRTKSGCVLFLATIPGACVTWEFGRGPHESTMLLTLRSLHRSHSLGTNPISSRYCWMIW